VRHHTSSASGRSLTYSHSKVPKVTDEATAQFYEENKERLYRNNPLPTDDETNSEKPDNESGPLLQKSMPAGKKESGSVKPDGKKTEDANQPRGDDAVDVEPDAPDQPAVAQKPGQEGPDQMQPLPEFRPLDDDLKSEIRDLLKRKRTQAAMQQTVNRAIEDVMLVLGDRYAGADDDARKLALKQEIAEKLRTYAKAHGLRYAETGLLSAEELADVEEYPIGMATEPVEAEIQRFEGRTVVDQMFEGRADQLYQPYQAQDVLSDNRFAYWKVADEASHIPRFDDAGVSEQVLKAWKINKARPMAEKRAKELSEKIGDKSMSDALYDETVTGNKDGPKLAVLPSERFSWLRTSTAPSTGLSFTARPELSPISTVEGAGNEFMRIVFNEIENDAVGVAPNADRSIYYVVRVKNRVPANPADDESFKQQFIKERLFAPAMFGSMFRSTYDHLAAAEQQELTYRWSQRLEQKYAVYWNPQRHHQP